MKTFAFTLLLVAGVSALPEPENVEQRSNERFVAGIIRDLIEDLSNDLQERGYDPYINKGASYKVQLPVTDLIEFQAFIENILLEGISNIKINRNTYSLIQSRLLLDLSLPAVRGNIESSEANLKFFGHRLSAKLSGSLGIEEIRIRIDARFYVGIITGVSIRSLSLDFSIHEFNSNLYFEVSGRDLSVPLNTFFNKTVPNTLKEHSSEVNKLLEHYIREIIEQAL